MANKLFLVEFKDPARLPKRVLGKGRNSVAMKVAGCRLAKALAQGAIKSLTEVKPLIKDF